jgi:hypothetical protein
MDTEKNQQLLTIEFENVPTAKADELAGELKERLLRANPKIQIERHKSIPRAQLLGDLLQLPISPIFDHVLIAIILDFAKERGIEIVLKTDKTIIHKTIVEMKGSAKDVLQKIQDFFQNPEE